MNKNTKTMVAVGDILLGLLLAVMAMPILGMNGHSLESLLEILLPITALVLLARGVMTIVARDGDL